MPIASGATIGPYKVDREIGRGGMGVVFLAHDTRLGRMVALKALPDDVAIDPDRLQRFEREARVLASLNHPNIAAIYGLEEADGRRYLALEHIEGETLADRITRGPLPLPEALDVAIQIASGMEAAHDAGVVHRDLKPANVMITPGDHVKILDFGLAKGRVATDESGLAKSPALVDSPTLSSPTLAHSPTFLGTMPGLILGTAAYLSPEQARGKIVDRRTDIWSFGCLLYECLTGRLAFEGETVSDTIAKILERPMDWSALPKNTPPRLGELLERCLERDPKRRLRDIGDARLALDEIKSGRHLAEATVAAPTARRRTPIHIAVSAGLGILLGAALAGTLRPAGDDAVKYLTLALPQGVRLETAVSDGRTIAFVGVPSTAGPRARGRIYTRRMDEPDFVQIPGTEGCTALFMSPDGRTLEYWAPAGEQTHDLRRFRMPTDRSASPVPVGEVGSTWDGNAVWLHSGDLIVSMDDGLRYLRIPANGGTPSAPQRYRVDIGTIRLYPTEKALPGDRVLLRATWYEGGVYHQGVGVLDPRSGTTKIVVRDGGNAAYHDGILLFARQDALFAARFDPGRVELKGTPVGIMSGLRQQRTSLNAEFGWLPDGTLAYASGGDVMRHRRLIVVDRQGKITEWSPERRPYEYDLKVAPDGSRAIVQINNASAITEIWVSERGQPAARRLQTRPGADVLGYTWSADGRSVAFTQNGNDPSDGIYVIDVDGTSPARRIAKRPSPTAFWIPHSWSADGTMTGTIADSTRVVLWTFRVPTDGSLAVPRVILSGDAVYGLGLLSPDRRFLAFQSNMTGRPEQYVIAWDGERPSGQPVMVSREGGEVARWSRDSKRLYFKSQGKVMSSEIAATPRISASAPAIAWDLDALHVPVNSVASALFDVLPDGRLLTVQATDDEGNVSAMTVALHFDKVIRKRMRAASK